MNKSVSHKKTNMLYLNSWVKYKQCKVINICWEQNLGSIGWEDKIISFLALLAE